MREGNARPPAEEGSPGAGLALFRRQAESRPEAPTNGHKEGTDESAPSDVMKGAKKMFKGLEDTFNQNVMKMRPAWWSNNGAASSQQASRLSPSSADATGSRATASSSSKPQASTSSTSSATMGHTASQNVDNTAMQQHFVLTERLVRMGLSPHAAKVAMHHLDDWVVSAIGATEMGTAEATAKSLGEPILRIGDVVRLQNMDRKNHQCNGLQGSLEAYSAENQRWLVALHSDGQKYWIRPSYLDPVEPKGPMNSEAAGEPDSSDPAWMEACTHMLSQREEQIRKKQENLEAREIELLEREERIMLREESLRQFEDSLRKSQASVEVGQQLLGRQHVSLASEQARVMKDINGAGHFQASADAIAQPLTMERALSEGSTSKDGSTVGGEADEVWDMDWAELATNKAMPSVPGPPVPFGRTLSDSCSSDAGSTSFVDTSNPARVGSVPLSPAQALRQESGVEAPSTPVEEAMMEASKEPQAANVASAGEAEGRLVQTPLEPSQLQGLLEQTAQDIVTSPGFEQGLAFAVAPAPPIESELAPPVVADPPLQSELVPPVVESEPPPAVEAEAVIESESPAESEAAPAVNAEATAKTEPLPPVIAEPAPEGEPAPAVAAQPAALSELLPEEEPTVESEPATAVAAEPAAVGELLPEEEEEPPVESESAPAVAAEPAAVSELLPPEPTVESDSAPAVDAEAAEPLPPVIAEPAAVSEVVSPEPPVESDSAPLAVPPVIGESQFHREAEPAPPVEGGPPIVTEPAAESESLPPVVAEPLADSESAPLGVAEPVGEVAEPLAESEPLPPGVVEPVGTEGQSEAALVPPELEEATAAIEAAGTTLQVTAVPETQVNALAPEVERDDNLLEGSHQAQTDAAETMQPPQQVAAQEEAVEQPTQHRPQEDAGSSGVVDLL